MGSLSATSLEMSGNWWSAQRSAGIVGKNDGLKGQLGVWESKLRLFKEFILTLRIQFKHHKAGDLCRGI